MEKNNKIIYYTLLKIGGVIKNKVKNINIP